MDPKPPDYEFHGMGQNSGIIDPCPSCGQEFLFVGAGGWLTCAGLTCKEPGVTQTIAALRAEVAAAHAGEAAESKAIIERKATCGTCRYFDVFENDDVFFSGLCRRYAPRPYREDSEDRPTDWPYVSLHAWCGEHQPSESPPAADTGTEGTP